MGKIPTPPANTTKEKIQFCQVFSANMNFAPNGRVQVQISLLYWVFWGKLLYAIIT